MQHPVAGLRFASRRGSSAERLTSCATTAAALLRFLAPGERTEHVALVSYPRSGNSLLRALLEEVTGIVTGTDTRPNRTLSRALSQFGMQGEGVLDERVWIVKTHWPERAGYEPWKARRAILLVRNPFDCFDSYFNMTLTNTHNVSLAESQYEVFADVWDRLVRHEIEIWRKFNEYWLASGVPLIAVRYEDLVREPHEVLRRVVTFVERGASGGVADDTALRAHIAAVLARARVRGARPVQAARRPRRRVARPFLE